MNEFKCTHGPRAVCIHCMGKRPSATAPSKTPPPDLRCTHPPNVRCPKCMSSKPSTTTTTAPAASTPSTTHTRMPCAHGPGMVCVNCQTASAQSSSKPRCTHPKGIVCPNCMPRAKPTQASMPQQQQMPRKCDHGPHGRCVNCIARQNPSDVTEEDEEDEAPELTCPNHGPHGSCLACMARRDAQKMRMKRQTDARCVQVRVDRTAIDGFQQYVRLHHSDAFGWFGWLLGTRDADGGTTVYAVYEPKQTWKTAAAPPDRDADDAAGVGPAWTVAGMLGLQRVGWIFSHTAQRSVALTATEAEFAARMQATHGPTHFVTLALAFGGGSAKLEAFQVSDQAVELARRGKIAGCNEDKLQLTAPVVAEGADTTSIDPAWVTVAVPLVALPKERCMFASCAFPPQNRPDSPVLPSDFRAHVATARTTKLSPFSDFHFLVHLATTAVFDVSADLPLVCASVIAKKPRDTDDIAGYLMLLDALAESL